jgi:hypothetical protein
MKKEESEVGGPPPPPSSPPSSLPPSKPVKSSAKKKAQEDPNKKGSGAVLTSERDHHKQTQLVGTELWKSKKEVYAEGDRRKKEEAETERRRQWRYRPQSKRFDKYQEAAAGREVWVDRRVQERQAWVKGLCVDYSQEEGYKVIYRTEALVGFDIVEHLDSSEMQKRIEEQQDLNLVQSEFEKQARMNPWQLGQHLASNLEQCVALLQGKLQLLHDLEQRTLFSSELRQEMNKVKSTYSIGRIVHLMESGGGRTDMSLPLMLASPLLAASSEAGAANSAGVASLGGQGGGGGAGGGRGSTQAGTGRIARLMQSKTSAEGAERDTGLSPDRFAPTSSPLVKPRVAFKQKNARKSKLEQILELAHSASHSTSEVATEGLGGGRGVERGGADGVESTAFLKLEQTRLETLVARIRLQQMALTAGASTGVSCLCLHPLHPLRLRASAITAHRSFQMVMNMLIFLSCVTMLTERPYIPRAERRALEIINLVISGVFILEAMIKIVSLGFGIYFYDTWNKLDLAIVVSSVVDIILTYCLPKASEGKVTRVSKILRIFRALRPIKVLFRSERLEVLLRAVVESMQPLLTTLVISCLHVAVFAVIGMELLQGHMHFCSDLFLFKEEECVGQDAGGKQRLWQNFNRNFDWFCGAWSTVFLVGTQDDWQQVLFAAVDTQGVGEGAQRHANEWLFVYFFPLIVLLAFFQVNLLY